MQGLPAEKPLAAPVPKGWRRARRRRRQRTFHEDFPSWSDKIRAVLALLLYGLALAVFVAGPFVVFMLSSFGWFEWKFEFKATGLILLVPGLMLLALGYATDPGIARQKKRSTLNSSPQAAAEEK